VSTYYVVVNVTLSIEDKLVRRAREVARRRGMSLNQLIRDFLEEATSDSDPGRVAAELERLWSEDEGASGGWEWNREEIHDRSKLR
jgi:hypothetical protein